jgi:uncharacterized protein (UPF0276 family)
MTLWVGLSLMLEDDFRSATAPLFLEEAVDVLEWSFDTGWGRPMPDWAEALLDFYAGAGRLLGHGVHFSPLSATWEPRQDRWLEGLAREVARRRYIRVSEHYGFMTAPPFQRGAPLPLPRSQATLAVGRDRLARLHDVARCPIGLENLALAWTRDEALLHGGWLGGLLEREDDFVVLDVHNLHCQIENFEVSLSDVLGAVPVERVREIHVSGGSDLPPWPNGRDRVRCDTHDDRIPEPVFDLLRRALECCPNVLAVIFERLGGTIRDETAAETVRDDFRRVRSIVSAASPARHVEAGSPGVKVVEDDLRALAAFQSALLAALVEGQSEGDTRQALERHPAVAPYRELVASIDGRALGIASRVTKKYARRSG